MKKIIYCHSFLQLTVDFLPGSAFGGSPVFSGICVYFPSAHIVITGPIGTLFCYQKLARVYATLLGICIVRDISNQGWLEFSDSSQSLYYDRVSIFLPPESDWMLP
jgi:hypothetical protein